MANSGARYGQAKQAIEKEKVDELRKLLQDHPELIAATDEWNNSLLHHAATSSCIALSDALLGAGARVDARGNLGSTPLQWAASMNLIENCERLLDAGADIQVNDELGAGGTPLVQALFYGHRDAAEFLAQREVVPKNLRVAAGLGQMELMHSLFDATGALCPAAGNDRSWYRPHDEFPERPTTDDRQEILDEALCYACFNGQMEAAQFLLDHGADPNSKPHFATALHFATAFGSRELIDLLLDRGADPNVEDDSYASPPAGWAEWGGDSELAEYLSEKGAGCPLSVAVYEGDKATFHAVLNDLDRSVLLGWTGVAALEMALLAGQQEFAEALRQQGVELPLACAASHGWESEVKRLLEAGSSPNETQLISIPIPGKGAEERPQSALLAAAIQRHHNVVGLLLDARATVDAYEAAAIGDQQRLEKHLDEGHPVNKEDPFGRTVLHRAIQGHQTALVAWLVDHGADLEQPSDYFSFGGRALHVAAQVAAPPALLQLLLDRGAELNASLNPGTPLDCAVRHDNQATVAWLRDRGGKTAKELR